MFSCRVQGGVGTTFCKGCTPFACHVMTYVNTVSSRHEMKTDASVTELKIENRPF